MKKQLLFLLAFLPMVLISCSSSSDDNNETTNSLKLSDITGVWKSGDHFISFSSDNYYQSYLNDTLIDSGTFSISGETVTCNNNYLARKTVIDINKNSDKMNCSISYTQSNITKKINGVFTKSDDTPTISNHIIIGKSDTWLTPNFSATTYFTTNNGGYEEVNNGALKGIKRNVYYVYLYPYIYMQRYEAKDISHGSNSFNTDIPEILIEKVSINDNGTIDVTY
jgi:hypothetical protein